MLCRRDYRARAVPPCKTVLLFVAAVCFLLQRGLPFVSTVARRFALCRIVLLSLGTVYIQ
jgi:hypothetical protein